MAELAPRWQALLVGVSSYAYGADPGFAQALNSQGEFARALGRHLPGLIRDGLVQLPEPRYAHEVTDVIAALNAVHDADFRAGRGGSGLLFYYCGHGMKARNELCLAVGDSIDTLHDRRRTGLPIRDLMLTIGACAASRRKVVLILDCCYAGLAADEPEAERAHLLMAVDGKHKATHDPSGIGPTYFTSELVRLLRDGDPAAGERIDLETAYRWIARRLVARYGPDREPCERPVKNSGRIVLGANRAWTGS